MEIYVCNSSTWELEAEGLGWIISQESLAEQNW